MYEKPKRCDEAWFVAILSTAAFLVLLASLLWCPHFQPKTVEVEKVVEVEVPVEVVVEKDVIVEKLIPIEVEKEVIHEIKVPVEKIVEVEVIKEVVKEVPIEVEKEVIVEVKTPVEVLVEKIVEVEIPKYVPGRVECPEGSVVELHYNDGISLFDFKYGGWAEVLEDGSVSIEDGDLDAVIVRDVTRIMYHAPGPCIPEIKAEAPEFGYLLPAGSTIYVEASCGCKRHLKFPEGAVLTWGIDLRCGPVVWIENVDGSPRFGLVLGFCKTFKICQPVKCPCQGGGPQACPSDG